MADPRCLRCWGEGHDLEHCPFTVDEARRLRLVRTPPPLAERRRAMRERAKAARRRSP